MRPCPLLKLEQQHGTGGDCLIAALASFLGLPYETVLVEAGKLAKLPHIHGLYSKTAIEISKKLGRPLRLKRRCNFETDAGILVSEEKNKGKKEPHSVLVQNNLIFDLSNMTVWQPEMYRKAFKAKFLSILVPDE